MKKLLLISLLLCTTCIANAQIKLGASVFYGLEYERFGLGGKAIYVIKNTNEQFELSPSINFYLTDNFTEFNLDNQINVWTFNFDIRYKLPDTEEIKLYPFVGFNATNLIARTEGTLLGAPVDEKKTNTDYGINAGFGAQMLFEDNIHLFAETKYLFIIDPAQLVISAGVLFDIN